MLWGRGWDNLRWDFKNWGKKYRLRQNKNILVKVAMKGGGDGKYNSVPET